MTQLRPSLWQYAMIVGLLDLQCRLAQLDWSAPLTREDIRAQWPMFPQHAYDRSPLAERFTTAGGAVCALFKAELQEDDNGISGNTII